MSIQNDGPDPEARNTGGGSASNGELHEETDVENGSLLPTYKRFKKDQKVIARPTFESEGKRTFRSCVLSCFIR
jgi:hypothetical protein